MQSGPSRDIDTVVDSWRDKVCNKLSATRLRRLAVRARGAGAAGQDQVVDELALSNLSDSGSIDQAQIFFACHGRLFLLRLQFMFYRAGRASDEGNCDKKARGRHRCCTMLVCTTPARGTRTSRGCDFFAVARAGARDQSAAAARYVQRGPRAGV